VSGANTAPDAPVVVRGTGSIGRRHLDVFGRLVGAGVLACPVRAETSRALSEAGVPVVGLDQLPERLRGAVVATETSRHLADVRTLLTRGDVLVEKPVAPSADGLRELHAEAKRLGRQVFVAFCLRFDASLSRFARRLPEVGAVDAVRIVCESYLPDWRPNTDYRAAYSARAADGGVLRDLAHELDYASWLFGRPREVYARLGNSGRLGIDADDSADLLWETTRGTRVSVRLSYLGRPGRRDMHVSGEHGELRWNGIAQRVTFVDAVGRRESESFGEPRNSMYERQAAAFLLACDGGEPGPLATLEEGAFVAALSDAARHSSKSGRAEAVSHWRSA
jgi:predicted dehydrogenase